MITIGAAALGVALALLVRHAVVSRRSRGVLAVFSLAAVALGGGQSAPDAVMSAALVVAMAFLAVAAVGRRRHTGAGLRTGLVIALYGANVVVTAIASPGAVSAIVWIAGIAVLVVLAAVRFTEQDRRTFLIGVVVLAIVQTGFAAYEVFVAGRPVFWDYTTVEGGLGGLPNPLLGGESVRVAGTMSHPIVLATLLAVASIVTLAASGTSPWIRWPVIVTLLGGILLSGTRSAIIALVIAAFFLLCTSDRRGRVARVVIGITLGAVALVFSAEDLLRSADALFNSGSFTNRNSALETAPALLLRPITEVAFGSGFDSEAVLRERGYLAQNGFVSVDNQLVTSLATQGLLGFVLVVTLLVVWFRGGDRLQRALAIAMCVFYFTFDDLRWPAVIVLLLPLLTMPADRVVQRGSEPDLVPSAPSPRTTSSSERFVPALRPRPTNRTRSTA